MKSLYFETRSRQIVGCVEILWQLVLPNPLAESPINLNTIREYSVEKQK